MAIELKGTIELKDITAVEFRCVCGYASIRKLDNLLQVPASCGNSNCDSWQVNEALQNFLRSIASYWAKERPSPSLHFHVQGLDELIVPRPITASPKP